jgi:hypothetical protein
MGHGCGSFPYTKSREHASQTRGILRAVVHVATSHRTEVLLEAFVGRPVAERRREGALTPVRVVVPNRNVETFPRLKVAERSEAGESPKQLYCRISPKTSARSTTAASSERSRPRPRPTTRKRAARP